MSPASGSGAHIVRGAAQLVGLLLHALTELVAELLAALGREGEADAGTHQATEREDADGPERRGPWAAPLLEPDRLEHVVLVDVTQILPGLQSLLPDVFHHYRLRCAICARTL